MNQSIQARNKEVVLEAFDTLFNKRDYARAEGMGGRLTIQSAAGQGTAISIVLPIANAAELEEP